MAASRGGGEEINAVASSRCLAGLLSDGTVRRSLRLSQHRFTLAHVAVHALHGRFTYRTKQTRFVIHSNVENSRRAVYVTGQLID